MNITTTPTRFPSGLWIQLTEALAVPFHLSAEETSALHASKTARLIAALPFLAGCDQADRTALRHVAVFILASKGPSRWIFDHGPADDAEPSRRLASIGHFLGGDTAILDRGMKLLTLQMISGYSRDQAKDLVTGEYNPLNSGAWDAGTLRDRLVADIVDTPCPEMDALFTLDDAQWTWWL